MMMISFINIKYNHYILEWGRYLLINFEDMTKLTKGGIQFDRCILLHRQSKSMFDYDEFIYYWISRCCINDLNNSGKAF